MNYIVVKSINIDPCCRSTHLPLPHWYGINGSPVVCPYTKKTQYLGNLPIGDTIDVRCPSGLPIYNWIGVFDIKEDKKGPSKNVQVKQLSKNVGGKGITPIMQLVTAVFRDLDDDTCLIILFSMDKPGIEVCRSRLDLHTSTLDLCRSRLDVCRSKVMHINLRYLALWHCQKFRNLFLNQNVKFFFLNSVYKLPKLTILNNSMFQLGPM